MHKKITHLEKLEKCYFWSPVTMVEMWIIWHHFQAHYTRWSNLR
ncbi:hypothetical protein GBAR_LOCUS17613 [Geodia barretti]|uniref:Uncharacterized protein n=1 Tax=Geodia barretti TaxID=519541 RepID=A0AA35SLS6_GEOBA|nr:hypothetical protein GBAR_LOCUS17613 [Geodia barretti]